MGQRGSRPDNKQTAKQVGGHVSSTISRSQTSSTVARNEELTLGPAIGRISSFGTKVYNAKSATGPVAVKIVKPLICEGLQSEHVDEAIRLVKLAKHPNIVEFEGYKQGAAQWITELMDENLESFLARPAGRLQRDKQIDVCWQMASGVLFLHQQRPPFPHGNLHSRNVLVKSQGTSVTVKIGDLEHAVFRDHTTTSFSTEEDISSLGRLMLEVAVQCTQQQQSVESAVPVVDATCTRDQSIGLSKLPEDHALKLLITKCLVEIPCERPLAEQVILSLVRAARNDAAVNTVLTNKEEISSDTYGELYTGQLGNRKVHVRKLVAEKVYQSLSMQAGSEPATATTTDRLMDECRIWELLKHPNIVTLHGMYRDNQGDGVVVVTEPVDQTLNDFLCGKAVRQLTESQQIDACLQVSSGLMYMHQHSPQVLHRALTSSSIVHVASKDGSQFMIDCLSAQVRFRASIVSASQEGTWMPEDMAYLSPERLRDACVGSDKSDIFSLGVIMLHIATQEKIPACTGLEDLAERQLLFSSMIDETHPLWSLILECLLEDPQQRPSIERVVFCLRRLDPILKQTIPRDLGCSSDSVVTNGKIGCKTVIIKPLCLPERDPGVRQIRRRPSQRQHNARSESSLSKHLTDLLKPLEMLKHPHLTEVIGTFTEDDKPRTIFVVMEQMNQNLETFLDGRRGDLSEDMQIDLSLQIASGILSLHQHSPQLCHGRLHSRNILLNNDGSMAKISDHGCSKFYGSLPKIGEEDINYIPPKFSTDSVPTEPFVASVESDVYSLGTLLLQIATQYSPHNFAVQSHTPSVESEETDESEDHMEAIEQDQSQEQGQLQGLIVKLLNDLSDDHLLKSLIVKCLVEDETERPLIEQVLVSLATLRSGGLAQFLHPEGTLGHCSYGEVYKARLGRKLVTVKEIHRSPIDGSHSREAFALLKEECKVWEGMHHPNIVKVLGFYSEGHEDTIVLVLEYLGLTLTEFIQDRKGDLSDKEKVDICLQMASGLMYLHQHNPMTIHCKLHDKNVLLSQQGTVVKITDPLPAMQIHSQAFNNVKSTKRASTHVSEPDSQLELSAQELFHPPECLKDPPLYTDKGDVYSLGLALFEVSKQDPSTKLGSLQELVIRRNSILLQLSDTALDKLIARCLQENPNMRPTSESVYLNLSQMSTTVGVANDVVSHGEEISRGSYGVVYKGTLGHRPVALKQVHKLLLEGASVSQDVTVESFLSKFKVECELMETAKHPNVVECIGLYLAHDSPDSLMIVMEYMGQNLCSYLEERQLSEERKVNMCFQIVSGLHYLHSHSPQILHRDLTAKNVLLLADYMTLKISDFGQSKFRPMNREYLTTKAPGCVEYMPPEVLREHGPIFNDKGDIFSFGVLALHIGCQLFPRSGYFAIGSVPEFERRKKDLDDLPEDYPLKEVILQCLKDDHHQRPDCEHVLNSIWSIAQKKLVLEVTDPTDDHVTTLAPVPLPDPTMPMSLASGAVLDKKLYVCGGINNSVSCDRIVHVYHLEYRRGGSWSKLPNAPQYWCKAVVVNGHFTLLGGREAGSGKITDQLHTWVEDKVKWLTLYPDMPTKRFRPGVVCCHSTVVVVGGLAEDEMTLLNTVEMMHTAARQWWRPAALSLPRPLYSVSLALCGDEIYMTGGKNSLTSATKQAWKMSCTAVDEALNRQSEAATQNCMQWVRIKGPPKWRSILVPNSSVPVAVGGFDVSGNPTKGIFAFNSATNKWQQVGELADARGCPCVVPTYGMSCLIVGGSTSSMKYNDDTLLSTMEHIMVVSTPVPVATAED